MPTQNIEDEQSVVKSQIDDFVAQAPKSPPPTVQPSATVIPVEMPAEPQPPPATPFSQPSAAMAESQADKSVEPGHRKKVIQPIDDPSTLRKGADFDALLAKEAEKAAVANPAIDTVITPSGGITSPTIAPEGAAIAQAPGSVVTPNSQPGQAMRTGDFDPNSVAL